MAATTALDRADHATILHLKTKMLAHVREAEQALDVYGDLSGQLTRRHPKNPALIAARKRDMPKFADEAGLLAINRSMAVMYGTVLSGMAAARQMLDGAS